MDISIMDILSQRPFLCIPFTWRGKHMKTPTVSSFRWWHINININFEKFLREHYEQDQALQYIAWLKYSLKGHGATTNSLLFDGGWLEFWEIVLLAAGDIESNPGPNQISDDQLATVDNRVLGKRDLFVVFDTVLSCRKDWFDLCFALRCSYDDLSAIKKVHAGDLTTCLREGLALWLEGAYDTKQHGPPSWRMLVAAVDNSSGGNNPALALEIAEKHKALNAFESSSPSQYVHCDSSHVKKAKEMSIDFGKLYRSLRRELRRVDVEEVKEIVRFSSNPHSLHERCVPLRVYEGATSTKDLLDQLYPTYINPQDTFLLEVIIENCGSRTCKRLLREYTNKFF